MFALTRLLPCHQFTSCMNIGLSLSLQYSTEVKEFRDGSNTGLKLTFLDVQLDDSGVYVCKASNPIENKTAAVELAIWPEGRLE